MALIPIPMKHRPLDMGNDYWSDPWGRVHEHWSDTDRLNAKNSSNLLSAEEGFQSQRGDRAPQTFIERVCS